MTFARIRSLVLVAVLLLAAGVLVVIAITRDTQTDSAHQAQACPAGYVQANLRLPEETRTIKINVYNATDTVNLATNVGTDFRNRKFTVVKTANDPLKKAVGDVAVLRYGPKTVGAAYLLDAYFLNAAKHEFDIARTDDVVDVVIGTGFRQLATSTEVAQAVIAAGPAFVDRHPPAPKGTCDSGF
ncbi:hypothetical protein F4553_005833 [Allocatelliglobosispora scoriae]|uniref:LytR/CpsA/Psr regulator C-terminal domain-containing protein n=1 Tax=Allocatelliglobosispora scoriae TaxID=643052 RepID=A0A841BZ80_9ACTN|nr:LytR C-terminal domain-containing protein [Allocatelliglobosispora scoriae]MBB5872399.1 hypothetical protein [Allocatelliglobosispora scoriae]